ncbi:MAG: ABC transporter permease [Anaerostipes sp.]|jgi:putative ABC transport system permease protein
MNKTFYPKLAISNIKKNGKFYFPYLVTFIGMTMMFYIMGALAGNKGIDQMRGAYSLKMIMDLGTAVIGIFSAIFLFYTNSFLMKRRQNEIGLYNILGMEKRHIARILGYETFFICVGGIVSGLILGIVLNKFMFLILAKMIGFKVPFQFEFMPETIVMTALLFGAISIVIFLWNIIKIKVANPIELLHGGVVGEKEPKTKGLLAVIGIICIGVAYYIAITTKNPLTAFMLFFVAVLLVIIGTYALFTAGSIVILKLLRKNKTFYYHPKHFTSISGMIYRMKQNAAGLSNICILSTMVLVMISTTTCLYIGVEDALSEMYPKDILINEYYDKSNHEEKIDQLIQKELDERNLSIKNVKKYSQLSFAGNFKDGVFSLAPDNTTDQVHQLEIITKSDYEAMGGTTVPLKKNEVIVCSKGQKLEDKINVLSTDLYVKKYIKDFPIESDMETVVKNVDYIVVYDQQTMEQLFKRESAQFKKYQIFMMCHKEFDLTGSDEDKIAFSKGLSERFSQEKGMEVHQRSRQENKAEFYAIFGGFLFLGIFLGSLFLMATALIIYYKQISEGYEDKQRFEIMQKVGMSKEEVKKTISSQIVMVFFLPLAMAGIHVLAAFSLMEKLLALFSLKNTTLFATCTIGTIVVFAAVYIIVYLLTAKVYYKIVKWN